MQPALPYGPPRRLGPAQRSVTLSVAAVQGILALATSYVSTSVTPAEAELLAGVTQLGFSATFPSEISYFIAIGALGLRTRVLPELAQLRGIRGHGSWLVALVASLLWWLLASLLLLVRTLTRSGLTATAARAPTRR